MEQGVKSGTEPAVFIDWLTISQHHSTGGLPIIVNGLLVWYDRCGNPRLERSSPSNIGGSFSTSVRVGCDGSRVFFSGNPGRYGREDNLFCFGWQTTIERTNRVLAGIGLPPFASAERLPGSTCWGDGGARIHRLDLTANYRAGSNAQARAVIRWLGAQSVSRVKRGMAGDESVWWANTRYMFKAYLKGPEMIKHGKSSDEFVVDWCERNGIVRVEVELKRRLLQELGLDRFHAISDAQLLEIYHDQTGLMRRVDRSDEPDILSLIPARYRMTAAAWLAGQDVGSMLSRATLFRHARVLRDYGIDIFQSRNIEQFPTRVRVVELEQVGVPDWYDLKAG